MSETRLTWPGNLEAMREATEAYSKLRPKQKKNSKKIAKRKKKNRRHFPVKSAENYYNYLNSPLWKQRRATKLRLQPCCEVCGAKTKLHVHHKHYRRAGCEKMRDLKVLCEGCHENEHEGEVPGVCDPMTREFLALDL